LVSGGRNEVLKGLQSSVSATTRRRNPKSSESVTFVSEHTRNNFTTANSKFKF